MLAAQELFQIGPGDCALDLVTFTFDMWLSDTYFMLSQGAKVILASSEEQRQPHVLAQTLKDRSDEITMFMAAPALYKLLMAVDWQAPRTLRLGCGGEAFVETL